MSVKHMQSFQLCVYKKLSKSDTMRKKPMVSVVCFSFVDATISPNETTRKIKSGVRKGGGRSHQHSIVSRGEKCFSQGFFVLQSTWEEINHCRRYAPFTTTHKTSKAFICTSLRLDIIINLI